jgi:hypothetical protein
MATLTSGDTLSLANLSEAVNRAASGERKLSLISGESGSGANVSLSSFAIDSVSGVTGFSYVAESTSETYTLTFTGEGSRFGKLSSNPSNFTWIKTAADGASPITIVTLEASPDYTAVYSFGAKNPQSPGAQTTLAAQEEAKLKGKFYDIGFNSHATNYDIYREKTIYVVDSYDGNTTDLCLTLDTLIQLADGTYIEAGDLEEGMVLKGSKFDGLEAFEDTDYINWTTNILLPREEDVTVLGLVYGFAERLYSFNNGLVKSTMEHPFLVKDENGIYTFKRAHLILTTDSFIKLVDGEYIETPIETIEVIEETSEIVSIDVDGSNIYFANNIVSHNKDQGNTHTDFGNPTAPTAFTYTTSTQTLDWSGATADADSVAGVTEYEVQWAAISDFSTISATKVFSGVTWEPWLGEISPSTITGAGTFTVSRYFRVRAKGNGGKYSGYTAITAIDGVADPNGIVSLTETVG